MKLKAPRDNAVAAWIETQLSDEWGTVASVVPASFEAYARVFHPAKGRDGRGVRWSTVAESLAKQMHARAQWHAIVGASDPNDVSTSNWVGHWPNRGNAPVEVLRPLCELLRQFTLSAKHCYLAYWSGWLSDSMLAPSVSLPPAAGRDYLLFEGSVQTAIDVAEGQQTSELPLISPSFLWPADRAWFLASEIDFDSTLVGGSEAAIDSVLSSEVLEAWKVDPDDCLTADSDDRNRG